MMGMTEADYNLSWLITTVAQMTLVSVLITVVTSSTIFEYSNKFFVFVYFEAFSLAVISMCFLLSSLFSKSKTASLLGPMMFFVSFFPYYAINDPDFSTTTKTATCILAPACFALGANVFADYEGGLVGIQADNYAKPSFNFSYPLCIGMLLFDTVLYGIMVNHNSYVLYMNGILNMKLFHRHGIWIKLFRRNLACSCRFTFPSSHPIGWAMRSRKRKRL